jgi:ssDNA-binding replication factor A large subunit
VLFDVIELLDDTLAREACNKINVTDDIIIQEIQSSTLSPIFYNIKDRAYIVKDFIIKYEA